MKKTEHMNRTALTTVENAITFLKKGRADIAILTQIDGLRAIANLNANNVKMLEPALGSYHLYHYLHKKNIHLVDEVTAVMRDMENKGEVKAYRTKVMENLVFK